jgi:ankyrin repeat protein
MQRRNHFLMAIQGNHPEAVARLVHDVNLEREIENKKTPIQLARALGFWDCVKAIAENKKTDKFDKAKYGSALLFAVQENRVGIAHVLLEAGASTRWVIKGDRCLHLAVRKRSIPMITLLLSFNVDLTVENTAKQTPIQLARDLGFWDCVRAIAKNKKTDVADKAKYGDVLLSAIQENFIATTNTLLLAGTPQNGRLPNGDGCLHIAIRKGSSAMIALLFSFNVDLTIKNNANQTPRQLARNLGASCLDNGWRKYYNAETLMITYLLTVFVQANRQPHSKFYNVPNSILEAIIPYLSSATCKIDTIQHRTNTLKKLHPNHLFSFKEEKKEEKKNERKMLVSSVRPTT